jgi:hypothetical protein
MISQLCQGCRGPLVPSRVRWWERRLVRMTSRRPFRCAYCHKRCWIIPDGSEQPSHSVQEIAAWPTRDVSLDLASLDSPFCSSGLAQERRQTTEVPMRRAGDADCQVIISISSSLSTAAVTSLHVRRPRARATWSRDGADGSRPSSATASERLSSATTPKKQPQVLRGDELHLRATRPAH